VPALGTPQHVFLSVMAANVGVDPKGDIHWITTPSTNPVELLARGEVDAILGFAPATLEIRERAIGHVVVNSALDAPWSQYFCCFLCGNRNFVRTNPVATKRVLRAILKSADLCASDPAAVARRLVDTGFSPRYDYALETLTQLPYDKWREYDPEDSLRFYAVRLMKRDDQIDAAEDHLRRHRLALPERFEARVEGVSVLSFVLGSATLRGVEWDTVPKRKR
jgi:NitT/TauT family transport system substrate-binding protein